MPPLKRLTCPICSSSFSIQSIMKGPWQGYWTGHCQWGHHLLYDGSSSFTRIIAVREIQNCMNCGMPIEFFNVEENGIYSCSYCRWAIPDGQLRVILQTCPQCGKIADKYEPGMNIFGFVWKCDSGHIFGGSYPRLVPCSCWMGGWSSVQEQESQSLKKIFRCGECGSVLSTPNEQQRQSLRESLALKFRKN